MGKNAGHKARQASRHTGGGGGDAGEGAGGASGDGTMDASFHTAAWHEARLASLTSTRMSWDEYKQKQKEDREKEEALAGVHSMREHRAQLDAERAMRLGGGVSAGGVDKDKKKKHKKDKKKKDKKSSKERKSSKKSKKDRKRERTSGSSSSGSSGSDSEGEQRPSKKASGPVKLSDYLKS